MKITNVVGSPRKKSNSKKIASAFCETAEQKGATVRTYILNELSTKGCQGCYACKMKSETCIIKDDIDPILKDINESDILVLSTPTYVIDVPGQVKLFVDRLYSFLKPDFMNQAQPSRLATGKTVIFIQTQGAAKEMLQEIPKKFQQIFNFFGFSEVKIIRATDFNDPNKEVEAQTLKQARELAVDLF